MSSYKSEITSRRVLSGRPGLSTSYTYTTPSRQYVALDMPGRSSTNDSSYTKTVSSTTSSSSSGSGRPSSHTYHSESTTRNSGSGPRNYSYTTESTRSSDGPGSYFSSVSYKSPYGNTYRNFSTK